jgi:DNA-binding MarR family transcriptional regulator
MAIDSLSEDELAAWYPYLVYSGALLAALDADLKRECGISHVDYGVLMQLGTTEGRARRMGDLAATLAVQPSFLTYRIHRMVRQGLVKRVRHGTDRRGVIARLTPDGVARLNRAAGVHLAGVRQYFLDHVDPAALPGLADTFWLLHDQLVDPPSAPPWASRARKASRSSRPGPR